MSGPHYLRDLAETFGPPIDAELLRIAQGIDDTLAALEAAESALDHARRTSDPDAARVLEQAQLRAQHILLTSAA